MRRCLQAVGHLKVRFLEEIAPHVRLEEDDGTEEEQETGYPDHVLHGEIGVERDRIQWPAVLVLVLLDVDAIGVVGAHLVQRQDMHGHQHHQYQRQSDNVQRKEAVQGRTRDDIVPPDPQGQIVTDNGDGTEQRDYDLGPQNDICPQGSR